MCSTRESSSEIASRSSPASSGGSAARSASRDSPSLRSGAGAASTRCRRPAPQKPRYLPGLCNGLLVGVHAMTEPGSGSDSFALKTRANPVGDGFRLKGTKTFISNGPVADLVIVFALTDPAKGYHGGVTAFLVESNAPGFVVSQRFE